MTSPLRDGRGLGPSGFPAFRPEDDTRFDPTVYDVVAIFSTAVAGVIGMFLIVVAMLILGAPR